MSQQSIQSTDISIGNLFKDFYVVPSYQREYVWKDQQVEQLLMDIYQEWSGVDAHDSPEYFIGSIVVCLGTDGTLELIDGQQRMTTLFLVLCALRDRLEELGGTASGTLVSQIRDTYLSPTGYDIERYRLELQYEDNRGVLEQIGAADAPSSEAGTRSIANILGAFDTIQSFLKTTVGNSEQEVRGFYAYFAQKVKLIRIQTEDVAKALRVFETINDRGIGLDAMDLLKNLLFMNAEKSGFDRLNQAWKRVQDTIFDANEKPLRFLRYYILSNFEVEKLREDQIYKWLVDHEEDCGYASDPLSFVKELDDAATRYVGYLDQKRAANSLALERMQLLGGRAARQHVILLLAGRHLDGDLFEKLIHEIENLFFVYVVTHEPTRNFERKFAQWSPALRSVRSKSDLDEFLAARFLPEKKRLAQRFENAFENMSTNSVQLYRLKYVLGKLTQSVELSAHGDDSSARSLRSYVKGEFEIEHIHPRNPSADAVSEFGALEDESVVEQLGNLVLLEKSINASIGNSPFSVKRKSIGKSRALLTRRLVDSSRIGANTRIDRALNGLSSFSTWNSDAIARRQRELVLLARQVWDVPH